jgi:hypothetical protein
VSNVLLTVSTVKVTLVLNAMKECSSTLLVFVYQIVVMETSPMSKLVPVLCATRLVPSVMVLTLVNVLNAPMVTSPTTHRKMGVNHVTTIVLHALVILMRNVSNVMKDSSYLTTTIVLLPALTKCSITLLRWNAMTALTDVSLARLLTFAMNVKSIIG